MAIDIDKLLERIRAVDIKGMVQAERITVGDEAQPVVELRFLKLKGGLRNDPKETFRMIVGVDDPDERPNDLLFLAPELDQCDPFSKSMTVYMDANDGLRFGTLRWDPDRNLIRFLYLLPTPADAMEFPDAALLERILRNVYDRLLFHDYKMLCWSIGEDVVLSDDEKKAKHERLKEAIEKLVGPRKEDNGTV